MLFLYFINWSTLARLYPVIKEVYSTCKFEKVPIVPKISLNQPKTSCLIKSCTEMFFFFPTTLAHMDRSDKMGITKFKTSWKYNNFSITYVLKTLYYHRPKKTISTRRCIVFRECKICVPFTWTCLNCAVFSIPGGKTTFCTTNICTMCFLPRSFKIIYEIMTQTNFLCRVGDGVKLYIT